MRIFIRFLLLAFPLGLVSEGLRSEEGWSRVVRSVLDLRFYGEGFLGAGEDAIAKGGFIKATFVGPSGDDEHDGYDIEVIDAVIERVQPAESSLRLRVSLQFRQTLKEKDNLLSLKYTTRNWTVQEIKEKVRKFVCPYKPLQFCAFREDLLRTPLRLALRFPELDFEMKEIGEGLLQPADTPTK